MTTTAVLIQSKALSRVLETNPADQKTANAHFSSKLAFETDPSDVYTDMKNGETGFIVVDARNAEAFAKGHVPGSINLPYRRIDATTTSMFSKDKVIVAYCAGVYCNASTKAAARLTALGFKVKEMLDGLDGWRGEGYPVETGTRSVKPDIAD